METLTRNPFTDERLRILIAKEVVKRGNAEVAGMRTLYDIIQSLDPVSNPVTICELFQWLENSGEWRMDQHTDNSVYIFSHKKYGGVDWRIYLDVLCLTSQDEDYAAFQINQLASYLNIPPFTLYAEIKLKYGTK